MQRKFLEIISVDFDTKVNFWSYILHSPYIEKKWEYSAAVHQIFIDLKKPYDSVRREVL